MSRIRRAPKRLDEDTDEPVSVASVGAVGSGSTPEPVSPPLQPHQHQPTQPHQHQHQQATSWGSWLSSVAQRTQQGLDKLYEIANQPVKLHDGDGQNVSEGDRIQAADTLDDLISRARCGVSGAGTGSTGAGTTGTTGSPVASPNGTLPPNTQKQQLKTEPKKLVQDTINRLSTMAIAARDHWHQQLTSTTTPDEHTPRSLDDAFRLHDGLLHTERLLAAGKSANKQCRQRCRQMTAAELEPVAGGLAKVDGLFDCDCILESVVYAERSSIVEMCGDMERIVGDGEFGKVADRLAVLLADGPIADTPDRETVNRNRLGEATSLFCRAMSMITDHSDAQLIHLLTAQMISEVQLFAQQADLLEDGQYCQHLIVGAAYHLAGLCKLALVSQAGGGTGGNSGAATNSNSPVAREPEDDSRPASPIPASPGSRSNSPVPTPGSIPGSPGSTHDCE